ncbi:MAG TPA: electron transfer flavoprotein subunit alpha/FixB family protein [Bryobacteraceae bacterium]|nr:electron transfer flavoprotein subunit alpha/FixB family protein [Bryobacteraceae bacterium]
MSVLVVMEHSGADWHRISWETLAAGQQLGAKLGLPVSAVVLGNASAGDLASKKLEKAYQASDSALERYTADGYADALEQVVRQTRPTYVLLPHTYQVRDFAPKVATRFGKMLVSDVVDIRAENGVTFVRQLFQGKLNSDVRSTGEAPHFASIQAGAFRGDQVEAGTAPVDPLPISIDPSKIRNKPDEPFRESQRALDLTSADIIVAVGRGIKEQDNLALVQELTEALGGELAASRPICDNGWLPMERQVGSSGQTVAPKLYLAVGISGAIQHLVGMKGAKTIVAINKDPEAPIFEIADYGIVGDLFEVVPALVEEVKKAKGA